jgi:hypothetical protein
MTGIALVPVRLLPVSVPVAFAAFAFWVWMLNNAAQNKGLNDGGRVAWVLIIALVHLLGALIYFVVGRPKGNAIAPTPAP